MSPLDNRDGAVPSPQYSPQCPRVQIESVLSNPDPVEWNLVKGLLGRLDPVSKSCCTSPRHDPMGRLFLGTMISRNPPPCVLEAALAVYPDSITCNPAAFFTACRDATPELVTQMMLHVTRGSCGQQEHCPYPWITSEHVSIEGAQAMLGVFPQGVMMKSPCLSSLNLLDYFLMSPDMIEQRKFDLTLWNKFKLMLVAAEACNPSGCCKKSKTSGCCGKCSINPIEVILKRVFSLPGFLDSPKRAQHLLWLLHNLRWTDQWVFEKQASDGKFPIHHVLCNSCTCDTEGLVAARELAKLLLEAHPVSATCWVNGQLPLHMAIENGWPCHDFLLAIFPEALDTPDHKTELFPFQSAAKQHEISSSPMTLDVTFELLRANPTHAQTFDDPVSIGAQA